MNPVETVSHEALEEMLARNSLHEINHSSAPPIPLHFQEGFSFSQRKVKNRLRGGLKKGQWRTRRKPRKQRNRKK